MQEILRLPCCTSWSSKETDNQGGNVEEKERRKEGGGREMEREREAF